MAATAPFHQALAEGPPAEAAWVTTADGMRLRAALWPHGEAGTILLFTGRTEYVEKYGRAAADLSEAGFAVTSIDWRGQGLSERIHSDPLAGHVRSFGDYQHDVAALVALVREKGLPEPYHLLAHSMGGAIALRSLHAGLPVATVAFSAPMWGIGIAPRLRPIAWSLSWASRGLGLSHHYTPGTGAASYVDVSVFEENLLTTDPEMFAYMQRQTREIDGLRLGGPSLNWLIEALRETRALRRMSPPQIAAYAGLGGDEAIVDPLAVHQMMARWPKGRLEVYDGGRHELMMEREAIRTRFFAAVVRHMRGGAATPARVAS